MTCSVERKSVKCVIVGDGAVGKKNQVRMHYVMKMDEYYRRVIKFTYLLHYDSNRFIYQQEKHAFLRGTQRVIFLEIITHQRYSKITLQWLR